MKKNFVEALLKEPGHPWRSVLVQNELDVYQGIVDGYIETVVSELALDIPRGFGRHCIIVNEEGKLQGSRPNFEIFNGLDWVNGIALIVGVRRDELVDVNPDLLEYVQAHVVSFEYPDPLQAWIPEDEDIIDRDIVDRIQEARFFSGESLENELESLCEGWEIDPAAYLEDLI